MRAGIAVVLATVIAGCKSVPPPAGATSSRPAPVAPQPAPLPSDAPVFPIEVGTATSVLRPPSPPPPAFVQRNLMAPRYTEPNALKFRGYDCSVDCSGHEAGYQWAEANDIDDADECSGNSNSFIEGCRAYAEGQHGGSRDDHVGDDDDEDDGQE